MTSNSVCAFIDIVYVTDDFENDACFEVGQTYRLEYRLPSSPGQEEGISLTKEGSYYGWVRTRSRKVIDDVLQQGNRCFCKPEHKVKRWNKYDPLTGLYRAWQEGEAFFLG
ncbi:hypothetical protein QL093DRAFT_2371773 [Fusarium oxysporum]|nr:hypothetical protein QL093DRAFT_2371773 [Fusarium oxysporum]